MTKLSMGYAVETLPLAAPFRISGYVFTSSDVMVVTLDDGEHRGRGEGAGVYYLGDNVPTMTAALEGARGLIEAGASRDELRRAMPAGGARNAVDCAMWELEAKRADRPVWALAGVSGPKPVVTTFTLGADDPGKMAEGARKFGQARSIKVKLTGELDLDVVRVRAIREARPDVWLGVDGNQGFGIGDLDRLVAAMEELNVSLIEQPLARGREADLEGYGSPIPIAADESALTLDDVPGLVGRFDMFNIKLDKCGGLTEALMIAAACREAGLGVMVGNMVSTSLAMAPAFVLGQVCDVCDLDGPIFLKEDRTPGVEYRDGRVWCPDAVWGPEAMPA